MQGMKKITGGLLLSMEMDWSPHGDRLSPPRCLKVSPRGWRQCISEYFGDKLSPSISEILSLRHYISEKSDKSEHLTAEKPSVIFSRKPISRTGNKQSILFRTIKTTRRHLFCRNFYCSKQSTVF